MNRSSGIGPIALVVALAAASCTNPTPSADNDGSTVTSTDGAAGRSDPDESGSSRGIAGGAVKFGLAVPRSDPDRLLEVETLAGAEVGVVRVFTRWDTRFPTASHQRLLDDGRVIHLSVRARTDAGVVISWADIAAAEPGSAIHDRLVEWAEAIAPYSSQIYFTFNHEPETRDSAANGTAEEYVAAWRRVVEIVRANGGEDIKTVVVLGRGAYADGSIGQWYPGDDTVDVVGVDPYNWYDCQGGERPWRMPSELITPALDFAMARDKPLAIPEIASTEDPLDPGRKPEWIRALGDALESPDLAGHIEFVAWFSVVDSSWPDCDWVYDSSLESADALAELVARFAPDA